MNCLKCNFARKFPGDCKYVVCERFGGFRRVDGGCHETFGTNGERLKALDDCQRARFNSEWGCPPDAKCGVDGCKACWKKWFESPADMEFWRNFEEGKRKWRRLKALKS